MDKNGEVQVSRTNGTRVPGMQSGESERTMAPRADIFETTDAFVLLLDIPGAKRDAVSVTLEKEQLVVTASLEREIGESSYFRAFNLGNGIDRNIVDARLEEGVLHITLPKLEEARPKHIEVKVK